MRWIVGIGITVAVVGALWFLRGPLMSLFFSAVPEPVPEEAAPTGPTTATYASTTLGYSFVYPTKYELNENYRYSFSETKFIAGVAVSVGTSATGTNLSSDTRLSVEQLPRATACTADIFIIDNVLASRVADNETSMEYSYATTSGAGAGNVYEEMVYAIPGSAPCTAIRYAIHTTNVANYPEGTVREFDRSALLNDFHAIRRSLKLVEPPTEAAPTEAE